MRDLDALVRRHKELDFLIKSNSESLFVSDWNCIHPFYKEHFQDSTPKLNEIQEYCYMRSDSDLNGLIRDFHKRYDKKEYLAGEIITGNGSTTIISSFFIWLSMRGIKILFYIPPIYFTFRFFAKIYGIELRPISGKQLYEDDVNLNLPEKNACLLFTDPVWYAGHSLSKPIIERIIDWQKQTKSTVFIDGSFQYFKWNHDKYEFSSDFNKEYTFRLVCPSKALATHGMRFSYLLTPASHYESLDFILDNLSGSSSIYDVLFAKKTIVQMLSNESNNKLVQYTRSVYKHLIEQKIIEEAVIPNCGYFVYGKANIKHLKSIEMDGVYFEQTNKKYQDYIRINLLSPAIGKLLGTFS